MHRSSHAVQESADTESAFRSSQAPVKGKRTCRNDCGCSFQPWNRSPNILQALCLSLMSMLYMSMLCCFTSTYERQESLRKRLWMFISMLREKPSTNSSREVEAQSWELSKRCGVWVQRWNETPQLSASCLVFHIFVVSTLKQTAATIVASFSELPGMDFVPFGRAEAQKPGAFIDALSVGARAKSGRGQVVLIAKRARWMIWVLHDL